MAKFAKVRQAVEDVEDIDMTPVMSLFVILIPALLLAAVFVKVNIINSPFPQFSGKSSSAKRDVFNLSLYIDKKGFKIVRSGGGRKKATYSLKLEKNEYPFEKLHTRFVQIKGKYPNEYRVNLYPDPNVPYETIVQVMDATRDIKKDDPTIYIKDQGGKRIKQEHLFPDVVWMGVVS